PKRLRGGLATGYAVPDSPLAGNRHVCERRSGQVGQLAHAFRQVSGQGLDRPARGIPVVVRQERLSPRGAGNAAATLSGTENRRTGCYDSSPQTIRGQELKRPWFAGFGWKEDRRYGDQLVPRAHA